MMAAVGFQSELYSVTHCKVHSMEEEKLGLGAKADVIECRLVKPWLLDAVRKVGFFIKSTKSISLKKPVNW